MLWTYKLSSKEKEPMSYQAAFQVSSTIIFLP